MRPEDARREAWRRVLLALMLLGGIGLTYLIFNVSRFERLGDINAMDYAQIARHVARGDGFVTSFIKPLSVVHVRRIEGHPDLTYPPLHVVWTAGIMRLLGPNDRAVSHASGLAFLLTMPVVFWLALRMFDWRTAVLATALCGTHITLLGYAVSGLETSLLALLLTLALLCLYNLATTEGNELPWAGAAGVLMGLIYLTKYVWVVAAVPVLVYLVLVKPERRLARAAVFIALLVVVALPWLIRNSNVAGSPFFTLRTYEMLGQTRAHPGNSIYRTFRDHYQSYLSFVFENPRAIFEKFRRGLNTFYASFPGLGGVFVTPFFLVAVLVRLGRPPVEWLRLLVYAIMIAVAVSLSLVMADPRLMAPVGPVIIVIATAFFWRLLDARLQNVDDRTRMRWMAVAVGVLVLLQMHPYVTEVTPDRPYGARGQTALEDAMTQLAGSVDGPVLTDAPWAVAWMSDRDAIWLPQTETDFHKLEDAVGRFEWVFLTPDVARRAAVDDLQRWADVWVQAQQGDARYLGFGMAARLSDGRWILMRRGSDE